MARRHKLKAWQHTPEKQRRSYVQPHTEAAIVLRTVRNPDNPFHEGLTEVRGNAVVNPRKAWNGTQHHHVVAVDRRIRESERVRIKHENELAKEERLLDQQVDAYIRRLENESES